MPALADIIGQQQAVYRLQSVIQAREVSHAYLFAGPGGVGKTTAARSFARALNCLSPVIGKTIEVGMGNGLPDGCGECSSCRHAERGSHPDIHVLSPALSGAQGDGEGRSSAEILISQVREMIRQLNLSPSMGRRKMFIITPAEAMNEQAQNALLKSLEEPPDFSTIILCTESVESVLATIRSRCHLIRFGLVPTPIIQQSLEERFNLDHSRASALASLCQGRIGRAIQYVREPARLAARQRLMDIIEASLPAGPLEALQNAGKLREAAAQVPMMVDAAFGEGREEVSEKLAGRLQVQMLLEELSQLLRDMLVLRLEGNSEALLVNADRADSLKEFAAARGQEMLVKSLEGILVAQDLHRRNVNPQFLMEDLLLQLAG